MAKPWCLMSRLSMAAYFGFENGNLALFCRDTRGANMDSGKCRNCTSVKKAAELDFIACRNVDKDVFIPP